jgi:hypothetical protein
MPSGYLAGLPSDVLLDAGVLFYTPASGGGAVPIGVTRGGVTVDPMKDKRNVDFDGKRAPVLGLDRVVMVGARISAKLLQFGPTDVQRFVSSGYGDLPAMATTDEVPDAALGATAVAARAATDAVPNAGRLFTQGQYLKNLKVVFQRGGGGTAAVIFALAKVATWKLAGQNQSEGEIDAAFEVRQDLSGSTDTDVVPYTVEIAN